MVEEEAETSLVADSKWPEDKGEAGKIGAVSGTDGAKERVRRDEVNTFGQVFLEPEGGLVVEGADFDESVVGVFVE